MTAFNRGGDLIPAEPFVAWIRGRLAYYEMVRGDLPPRSDGQHGGAVSDVAAECGISERTVYRYARSFNASSQPVTSFYRNMVEDMLDHAGTPFRLIYPDLDDIDLEPDEHCPKCRETTTPVQGICPWCETPVGANAPKRCTATKLRGGRCRRNALPGQSTCGQHPNGTKAARAHKPQLTNALIDEAAFLHRQCGLSAARIARHLLIRTPYTTADQLARDLRAELKRRGLYDGAKVPGPGGWGAVADRRRSVEGGMVA